MGLRYRIWYVKAYLKYTVFKIYINIIKRNRSLNIFTPPPVFKFSNLFALPLTSNPGCALDGCEKSSKSVTTVGWRPSLSLQSIVCLLSVVQSQWARDGMIPLL